MNQRGEKNHWSKLTEADVLNIRRTWANNKSAKELAAMYGVSRVTIEKVVNQISWTHLPSVDDFRRRLEWEKHLREL